MSMVPFFPSLKPLIANCIWFEADVPYNDEVEVQALEQEQHAWVNAITSIASDLHPLGKVLTMAGPETDDEDANDDSDDSDSHDEEDDDELERLIESADARIRMQTSYSPGDPQSSNNEEPVTPNQ